MIKFHDWLLDRVSIYYQMWLWVFGKSIHNTLRDECCPDFSCCANVKKTPFLKRLWYAIKYPFWRLWYNFCVSIENASYKKNIKRNGGFNHGRAN